MTNISESLKIKDKYILIVSSSRQELEQEVNAHLVKGYKPQGGIQVEPSQRVDPLRPWLSQRNFYQAMFKD